MSALIVRHWLLTWTTYGTWLPGDERGFVSPVRTPVGKLAIHNQPGTPCDRNMPALMQSAQARMKGEPVFLRTPQAETLLTQFQETANHRGWQLLAAAIMRAHVHLLVGVPDDPEPDSLLRDFKAYGSRALNRRWQKPASGTWWTASGSRRKKQGAAIASAVRYVSDQKKPLRVWIHPDWQQERTPHRSPFGEGLAQLGTQPNATSRD